MHTTLRDSHTNSTSHGSHWERVDQRYRSSSFLPLNGVLAPYCFERHFGPVPSSGCFCAAFPRLCDWRHSLRFDLSSISKNLGCSTHSGNREGSLATDAHCTCHCIDRTYAHSSRIQARQYRLMIPGVVVVEDGGSI